MTKHEHVETDLQRYSDGHPQDHVQYLEAKIILKPDGFVSLESFREFGRQVQRVAKHLQIGMIHDAKIASRPDIREILFLDTSDFRLYRNSFILRRRIRYVDGFPVGDPEIVCKFRHPDEQLAASMDMRPKIAGDFRIKFKLETLPLKDRVGGSRALYSHNCEFGLSQMRGDGKHFPLSTLCRVVPALASVESRQDEEIHLVNEAIVEEVLLELGHFDFGSGIHGKTNVALWRTRGEHLPLVGEFAFQVKFKRASDLDDAARKKCEQLFISLQHDLGPQVLLGSTKTGIVYQLKGSPPQSHE